MTDMYPECVLDLYRSEVFGERISLAMLPWAKTDVERYKLATIAQLETETKARLRPFLMSHGLSVEEEDVSAQVNQLLPLLTSGTWRDFMAGMREDLMRFATRFEDIERLGPSEDQAVLHSMVVHERALISFTERELAGQPDSLAEVVAQLQYPLPAP